MACFHYSNEVLYLCVLTLCSGDPVKVPLPGQATQVACGDNHTVVLLASGQVITFGKHQEGQLGRNKEEEDGEDWYAVPRQITGD